MKLKALLVLPLLTLLSVDVISQNLTDALRYSQLLSGGSARVLGAGGSFGSLGGDFGVTSLNVAGLADYRSKELMVTLSYNQANTSTSMGSDVVGENNDGREVILEAISYVSHSKPYYSESLVTSNFGIGLIQLANFNQTFSFDAQTQGSIVEEWAAGANANFFGPFDEGLAEEAGAIYFEPAVDSYTHDYATGIFDQDGELVALDNQIAETVAKEQVVERSGSVNELVAAWAGKFRSGINVGIGLGLPFVSFTEDKFYEENDLTDFAGFNQLNFNESFTTSGVGVNLKLGVGYTIARQIRLGIGYQTPTFFRLDDAFLTSIVYDCDLCLDPNALNESPDGSSDYRLRTPMRTTFSIGYLLNKSKVKGFLNVDLQRIDYTSNSFNFTFDNNDPGEQAFQDQVNGEIENELRPTYNILLGGELVYGKWRVRGGTALIASPFFFDEGVYDTVISGGLGYRLNKVFFDLSAQFRNITEGYTPYTTFGGTPALPLQTTSDLIKVALTMGIKL